MSVCHGVVTSPVLQGKKKKRKREKLQESASGRPCPALSPRVSCISETRAHAI